MNKTVYLDNAATTVPFPEILMDKSHYANPSSPHFLGKQAKEIIENSRQIVADCLSTKKERIFFTSGGTISNNIGILGNCINRQKKKIITCVTEHASVISACDNAKWLFGNSCVYLPVSPNGSIDLDELAKELTDDTVLVTIMHVNNETGTIMPVKEIGKLIKEKKKEILFHVDGVQGFGKVPFSLEECNVDAYSVSSHKINGLAGSGCLFLRSMDTFTPLIGGGMQEKGVYPGTENVSAIDSFAKACKITFQTMESTLANIKGLHNYARESLLKLDRRIKIYTPDKNFSPYILNFSLPDIKNSKTMDYLSKKGIYVSGKSACDCKYEKPSHVLKAMGVNEKDALCAIRISFSYNSSKEDVNLLCKAIQELLQI